MPMPKRFRKRRLIKWISPTIGSVLIVMVVTWPSAVGECMHEGQLTNCVFGMTYHGTQANGQLFLLKAPSAHKVDEGHIFFDKPSIKTKEINMQARTAKLDVKKSRIACEGSVEINHPLVNIRTHKAELYLDSQKSN